MPHSIAHRSQFISTNGISRLFWIVRIFFHNIDTNRFLSNHSNFLEISYFSADALIQTKEPIHVSIRFYYYHGSACSCLTLLNAATKCFRKKCWKTLTLSKISQNLISDSFSQRFGFGSFDTVDFLAHMNDQKINFIFKLFNTQSIQCYQTLVHVQTKKKIQSEVQCI